MKKKIVWVSIFLLGSIITSGFIALGISTPSPAASNLLSANLGVVPFDVIYYRWRNLSSDDSQGMIIKYQIASISDAKNEIKYNIYIAGKAEGMSKKNWTFQLEDSKTDHYNKTQAYGHQFQLTNITNIALFSTELTTGFKADFHVTTPTSFKYITDEGYHKIQFAGNEYDEITKPVEMEVWVKTTTGLIEYMYQNSTNDGEIMQELIWYSKSFLSSKLPIFPVPNTFNFVLGDKLTTFLPNEGGATNDGGLFRIYSIRYIYHNPYTTEDVIMVDISTYDDLEDPTPAYTYIFQEEGRIIRDDWESQVDSHFSQPGAVTGAPTEELRAKFEDMYDVTIASADFEKGTDYVKFTTNIGEYDFEFYGELLNGYGFPEVYWLKRYNETTNYEKWDVELTIDGPGVVESHPMIGVVEGDIWTAWMTQDNWRREWNHVPEYIENFSEDKGIFTAEMEITHIFALNTTVMAILGNIRLWESTHPDYVQEKIFTPFLIFDTTDPASFLTGAGYETMEGPPLLLPLANWSDSTLQSEVLAYVASDDGFGVDIIRNKFTSNSMRFAWDERVDNNKTKGMVMLEMSSTTGIVVHLEVETQRREEWLGSYGYNGIEKEERTRLFVVEGPSCETPDISAVTNVEVDDVLIWEHQSYHPGESTVHKKSREKLVIMDVVGACDGSVVFLGARYWKDAADISYSGDYWTLDADGTLYDINFWMLSSVRDDDLWSWMQGQIFDKGVYDLSGYTATISEMLNYAFNLPSDDYLTADDIIASGRTFTITLDFEEDGVMMRHIMKFAANEEGLLQDMIQGAINITDGTWLNWERTVLVSGPGVKGEYFTDVLPDYEIADITPDTTPTPPFIIPGYPTPIFLIIAIFAISVLLRKRHA